MQTLIAIGALAITITFALTTQRAEIKTDRQKIMAETQILAGQVATDVLTHISIQEFDASTKDRQIDNPRNLTRADTWPGGGTFGAAQSVEDFHNMETHTVTVAPGLSFELETQVRYVAVDEDTRSVEPSMTQTFQKEVIVTVRDAPRVSGGEPVYTLPAPIELRQIVSMSS